MKTRIQKIEDKINTIPEPMTVINTLNRLNSSNQTSTIGKKNPAIQSSPINQIDSMHQITSMDPINPMKSINPLNESNSINQNISMNQTNKFSTPKPIQFQKPTHPKQENTAQKKETEIIKLRTSFRLKFDLISLLFIVVFIISFDIMQGIVNTPEYKQYVLIVQSILVSALIGISSYAALAPALQVYPTFSNRSLMDDIMKCMPFFIGIMLSAVLTSSLIPGSRLSIGDQQIFAAMFAITNSFSEEMTFALFLCTLLFAKSKNKTQLYVYNAMISGLFLVYHLFVYGNPAELIHMFIMRFMLNLSYMKSQRISVPILFHVINNLYASLPILMGGI